MVWTTSANLPFFPLSQNLEMPLSASRRKRTAGSGLPAMTEEDCGSALRRERPRGLHFLKLAFRASTKPGEGRCGLRLTRLWRSDLLAILPAITQGKERQPAYR